MIYDTGAFTIDSPIPLPFPESYDGSGKRAFYHVVAHNTPLLPITNTTTAVEVRFQGDITIMETPAVGQCWIADDKIVNIFFRTHASTSNIFGFFSGPILAVMSWKAGFVPFHASAVAKNGRAALFLGASGSGKSTIATSLSALGWNFLADDVAVLLTGPLGVMVAGCCNTAWLFNDSLAALKPRLDDVRNMRGNGKQAVSVTDLLSEAPRAAVKVICTLASDPSGASAISAIKGRERAIAMIKESLMQPLVAMAPAQRLMVATTVEQTLNDVDFVQLSRPLDFSGSETVSALLEKRLSV